MNNTTNLDKNSLRNLENRVDLLNGFAISFAVLIALFILQLFLIIRSSWNYMNAVDDGTISDFPSLLISLSNGHSGITYSTIVLSACVGGLVYIFGVKFKRKTASVEERIIASLMISVVPAGLFYLVYYFMFLPFALPSILQLAFSNASGEDIRQIARNFTWYSRHPLPLDELGVILLALVVSVSTIFIGHRLKLKVTHGVTTVTSTN